MKRCNRNYIPMLCQFLWYAWLTSAGETVALVPTIPANDIDNDVSSSWTRNRLDQVQRSFKSINNSNKSIQQQLYGRDRNRIRIRQLKATHTKKRAESSSPRSMKKLSRKQVQETTTVMPTQVENVEEETVEEFNPSLKASKHTIKVSSNDGTSNKNMKSKGDEKSKKKKSNSQKSGGKDKTKKSISEKDAHDDNDNIFDRITFVPTPVVRTIPTNPAPSTTAVAADGSNIPPAPVAAPSSTVTSTPTTTVIAAPDSLASAPVTTPGDDQTPTEAYQVVPLQNYYVAMVTTDTSRSPTDEEFQLMFNKTTTYYTEVLVNYFAAETPDTTFVKIDTTLLRTAWDKGYPEVRYNIFMSYAANVSFTEDTIQLPTTGELHEVLMDSIDEEYIVNWVRTAVDTPFVGVNEVYAFYLPDVLPF